MTKIWPNKINASNRIADPVKIAEGYLLKDPDDGLDWLSVGFITIWLTIWCGISFPMFIAMLWVFFSEPSLDKFLPVLFISIFAAVGIIGLIWGGRAVYRVFRLKVGEIVLPTYPLRRGETYRVKYRRRLRQGRTKDPVEITAVWMNYEWVEYRRGTDIVTAVHELDQFELSNKTVMRGVKQIEYNTQVTVPEDAPVSIHAPHNQVRWELRVNIHIPGVAKDSSHFVVKVLSA